MSSEQRPPLPLRLSIAHLMLWTLGTAIALSLHRPFLEAQGAGSGGGSDFAARYYVFQKVITLSLIPFGGASIGALLLAIIYLARGGKLFPAQPGHWLLIVYGISYLAYALGRLIVSSIPMGESVRWGFVGLAGVIMVIQILPLVFIRDAPRWTVFFIVELFRRLVNVVTQALDAIAHAALATGGPNFGILQLAGIITLVLLLLGCIVLAITLIRELMVRPQRDYLHWTGCLTQVAIAVVAVAQFVFLWFLL